MLLHNYFFSFLLFFLWFSNDLIYQFLLFKIINFNTVVFFLKILIVTLKYLGFSGWSTGLLQLHSWRNIAGSKPKPVLCGGGIWLPGRLSCPRFVVLPDGEPAARADWADWADDGVNLLRYSLALDTSPMTNGLRPAGPNLAAKWRTTGAC